MHGVPAQTGFPRTLTKTIYISAIFSTLNPILSVANLYRLECAETPCIRVSDAESISVLHVVGWQLLTPVEGIL